NDARPKNLLRPIDICDEGVERLDPLHKPVGNLPPFGRFENPGDDVEGNDALRVPALAIDGESDADAAKECLRLLAPERQDFKRRLVKPGLQGPVSTANLAPGGTHFIEDGLSHRNSCLCGVCPAFVTPQA